MASTSLQSLFIKSQKKKQFTQIKKKQKDPTKHYFIFAFIVALSLFSNKTPARLLSLQSAAFKIIHEALRGKE